MLITSTIFLIIALICFLLDAITIPSRVKLTALGLAFLTAALLVSHLPLH